MLSGLAVLLAAMNVAKAQTLYAGSLGTTPDSQGWIYGVLGSATKSATTGSTLFDTTLSNTTQGGWTYDPTPDLNHTNGFSVSFTLRVNSESHSSTNRGGFGIIVIADDLRGVELDFWNNTIFAQSAGFVHAEDTAFATTGAFVNYALTFQATNYVLSANGAAILAGPLRIYGTPSGPLDPYAIPNLIFLGDDTSSASASINLQQVALIFPPALILNPAGVVSWTGVSNQTYRVLASTNLTSWTAAGTATSPTNVLKFTNTILQPYQYLRVAYP